MVSFMTLGASPRVINSPNTPLRDDKGVDRRAKLFISVIYHHSLHFLGASPRVINSPNTPLRDDKGVDRRAKLFISVIYEPEGEFIN